MDERSRLSQLLYDDDEDDIDYSSGSNYDEYADDSQTEEYDDYSEGEYDDYSNDEYDGYSSEGYDDSYEGYDDYSDEYDDGDQGEDSYEYYDESPRYRQKYAEQERKRRAMSKAAREKKRKRKVKMLGFVWVLFIIGVVGLVYIIMSKTTGGNGVPLYVNESEINFGKSSLVESIGDNYYQYLKKSYIMFGKYPDCQYVKISAKLARNTYDVENYQADENSGLKNYYVDGEAKGKYAIDVSSYQKKIDWQKVKAAGVGTAIIRVGYRGYGSGKIADDEMYSKHISGAEGAGMNIGVYFFTQAISYDEGVEEAKYVLDKISGHNITEPVIIDTELIYNADARANTIDNATRTEAIKGFCETVKSAGYTPMIYANRNWLIQNMDLEALEGYEVWLAHYSSVPDYPYEYSAWQYSGEGAVDGVKGQVDLNVWFR